jgi:hypothetical protein
MGDRRFLKASPDALLLYQFAMWYAVANRTDGLIEDDDLPLLARGDARYAPELEKVGLWRREAAGWLIVDYADTQTPKAQLEALDVRRRSDRERSQRYRDNRKGSKESRDASRDDKGQDRQGQARKGFDVGSDVNKPVADDDWPEPAPLGAARESSDRCLLCGDPIDPAAGSVHPACEAAESEHERTS